jgi:dienelactone hydrolase
MIKQWYGRRMYAWENDLALRATNRVVRPFEWGLEWTANWPVVQGYPRNGHDPENYLHRLNQAAIEHSEEFFGYERPADFHLTDEMLRFTSPVRTPYAENNTVHARVFPAKNSKKAVVVLPHWNASADQHGALCKGLRKLGITAVRISLPYHDFRMPAELERADYAVSSNIARTIDATRQAVIDVRSCFDWLQSQGYESLGIVGTSLGSCYAFLTSAHDERIKVNVFNHCSTYFADVVWTGLSSQHIRQGIEQQIDLDRLREAWIAISPVHYMDRFSAIEKKSLFIYATYDTTFPLHLSEQAVAHIRQRGLDHKVVVMPCGHYTLGETPFKFIDGYYICSYLKRNL